MSPNIRKIVCILMICLKIFEILNKMDYKSNLKYIPNLLIKTHNVYLWQQFHRLNKIYKIKMIY